MVSAERLVFKTQPVSVLNTIVILGILGPSTRELV